MRYNIRKLFLVVAAASIVLALARWGYLHVRSFQTQDDLDNIAICFREAVWLLQQHPERPDQLAVFMTKAKAELARATCDTTAGDFDMLRWSADGTALLTRSGRPIRCRLAGQSHDSYGPDGASFVTTYEFYVPGSEYVSRATVELFVP